MTTSQPEPVPPQLAAFAEKHTVCYAVDPFEDLADEGARKVGFDLELYGTHSHGETRLTPGCELCKSTFADLKQIASWIMPTELRASEYQIEPFDYSLHASPKRRLRPEVTLTLRITHREHKKDPVDECEVRCLKEMEEKLRQLGIHRNRAVY